MLRGRHREQHVYVYKVRTFRMARRVPARWRSLIDDNETTYRDTAYRGLGIYLPRQLSIEKWIRAEGGYYVL